MIPVYMTPTPNEARSDTTNSINQIVLRLDEQLPAFGFELVENPDGAQLFAGHAGQGALKGVDVAHCHGLYPTAMLPHERWHWAANAAVIANLRSAYEITVPSQWVADLLRRDMHIQPDVIPWAVDPAEWTPNPDSAPFVLWNKTRADSTCDPEPMNRLAEQFPRIAFISTFGRVADNVKIIGRQPFDAMRRLICDCGVFLATTKETFGIGILEAMAAAKPILGYAWGGAVDLVTHGVNGYLAEPGNLADLAQGLNYCIQHRETLGANARIAAIEYTWDKTAQAVAAVYERANARKNATPEGPLVSVVIPTHNYAHYLPDAIHSVRRQNAQFRVELVIVDDASTDGTKEALEREFGAANAILGNELVQVHYLDKNSGVAAARNVGIANARGKYIVCLDADDRLGSPEYLSTLAQALEQERTLGAVYTGLAVMDSKGEQVSPNPWPGEYQFDRQVEGHNQIPAGAMFRKQAWQRAGGFRRRFTPADDAHFWLTLGSLGYGAQRVTGEPMFHYRMHDKSLTAPIRAGEATEPDWREYAPWVHDGLRPFAAGGRPPKFTWPVRNYDQPRVSVVVPVGPGHVGLLREALDSIEAQTFRFWECIVVNDTGEPLPESLLQAYPWARFETTGGKKGAGAARNCGVASARAGLIAFLDSDDVYETSFLYDTLDAYDRANGEYIYTDWYSVTKAGGFEVNQTPEFNPNDVFRKTSIHGICVLIPRVYLESVGGFAEDLPAWEDTDLFMKLAAAGYCGKRLAKPLFTYRYTTGALRETGETVKAELIDYLREKFKPYIEGRIMCNCGGTSKPHSTIMSYGSYTAMAENAATNENMVLVRFNGPLAPVDLIGTATRTRYGRRQNGEEFYVWVADAEADPESFEPIKAEKKTVYAVPPAPPAPPAPVGETATAQTVTPELTADEQTALKLVELESLDENQRSLMQAVLDGPSPALLESQRAAIGARLSVADAPSPATAQTSPQTTAQTVNKGGRPKSKR